jgi:DNA-binding NtrC family response regulator
MLAVYKMIGRLATNDVPALVTGERGTGKRLVIATIHENSERRSQPFVSLDCGALPEASVELELYAESGGTIHLGAVEALSPVAQARLAAALAPALGPPVRPSAPRVLASTGQNLSDLAASGGFNRALFNALSIITLDLPPLRARREDIALLARHFIQRSNAELSRSIHGKDEHVAKMLHEHAWPGNVAELERVIRRACIVARGEVLTTEDIGSSLTEARFQEVGAGDSALSRAAHRALHDRLVQSVPSQSVYHDILDVIETALVREALTITNGNQVKAAEILGVNRATLRKKMPAGE